MNVTYRQIACVTCLMSVKVELLSGWGVVGVSLPDALQRQMTWSKNERNCTYKSRRHAPSRHHTEDYSACPIRLRCRWTAYIEP